MTGFAGFLPRNLNRRFNAFRGFFERDLQVVAKIGAALRTTPAALVAEEIAESEHVPEDVGEVAELVEHRRIEPGDATCRRTHALVPEAVVETALFGITEDRIRFGGFLESFLSHLVARISVRVVLHRELAIRALDLGVGCRARDGQD